MDSNGTPTNLDSIQDQIVVLATYLDNAWNRKQAANTSATSAIKDAITQENANLGDASVIQCSYVLPSWSSERVVRAAPSTFRKEVLLCVRTRE